MLTYFTKTDEDVQQAYNMGSWISGNQKLGNATVGEVAFRFSPTGPIYIEADATKGKLDYTNNAGTKSNRNFTTFAAIVGAEFQVGDSTFVYAGGGIQTTSFSGNDIDSTTGPVFQIGGGYRFSENFDLIADLKYIPGSNAEITDTNTFTNDLSSTQTSIGVRYNF